MPSLFVAARDSRHRTACFALYKALIQQGVRVPLPDDVLRAPGLEGPVHPSKHLIRKSFRRNRNDTSPRLVISALRNGYRVGRRGSTCVCSQILTLSFLHSSSTCSLPRTTDRRRNTKVFTASSATGKSKSQRRSHSVPSNLLRRRRHLVPLTRTQSHSSPVSPSPARPHATSPPSDPDRYQN